MKFLRLGKDNWARTRPTKEGIVFLGLSLFVGFAALNTGNNLLYLTFGMMLSFIAVSGITSLVNLSRIEVILEPPEDVFAWAPAYIRFSVKNLKMLIPSYSLTIDIGGEKAYLSYLPSKVEKTVSIQHVFKRRGWNKMPETVLFTRFPFGFFKKWIRIDLGDGEVLVYPRVERIGIEKERIRHSFGELESDRLGFGNDLRSIRGYNEGDNPKLIHWKTSAKLGRLMLRELQDDESRKATIEFNPTRDKSELEQQISYTASLLLELMNRDYEVEFVAPDRTFSSSELSRSPRPVLRYLALYN
jgi:uncharacterized protein (DUF58 family)